MTVSQEISIENFLIFVCVFIVPISNLETRESAYLIVEEEGEQEEAKQ